MDNKKSQIYSGAQNPSVTFGKSHFISDFGRSWLKLDDNELQCAKLTPESVDFTFDFQDKLEFCGLLEATGKDGTFMINYSIRLKNEAECNAQDDCMGIIDCKCLMEVTIPQLSFRDFYAKGSFQSQIYKDKESTGRVRFVAKEFLDKAATRRSWHLCIFVKIELSMTPSTEWKSVVVGTMYPVMGMEPPFLASLKSKTFADVRIECDGQILQAHKNVLSCASTVFARMLASSMMETTSKTIKIDDHDSSTIERMLDFIYTGKFTGLSYDALVDQLYCAETYDLEGLKAAASLQMVSTVSDFNVIKFLDAAMKCNVRRDFVDKLIQHCKSNFQSLSTIAGFKEFFTKHFDEFFCNHRVPKSQRPSSYLSSSL